MLSVDWERESNGKTNKFVSNKLGDINGDGRVTALDIEYLYNYINNKSTLTEQQLKRANVNGSGKVDNADLEMLAKWLVSGTYSYK